MKKPIRVGITHKIFPRPKFEQLVATKLKGKKLRRVMQAYRLAKYAHRNQKRRDLSRYFDHCKSCALILMLECKIFDSDMLVTELLHDTREDTFIFSDGDLGDFFGPQIERSVNLLTKKNHKAYYQQLRQGTWKDIVDKLVDRLHNLRSLPGAPKKFIAKQLQETVVEYFSLLAVLEKRVPNRHKRLVSFFRSEMLYACWRAQKSINK